MGDDLDDMPEGDAELALITRSAPMPVEIITGTDMLATALNRERLGKTKRIVDLACGHQAVTTNRRRCGCWQCHYLITHGYDYDAFRNLRTIDDPLAGCWDRIERKGGKA